MKKVLWVLLVFGLILSWTLVHAADFYVIPVKIGCTCKGTLVGTRWCDNGDGTVTDMTTCLVWLKYADWGGRWPWRSGTSYDDAHTRAGLLCDGAIVGKHPKPPFIDILLNDGSVVGDWRLPTKTELFGLSNGVEAVSSQDTRAFWSVQWYYWSSTTHETLISWATWVSLLGDGVWGSTIKSNTNYVWPVRNAE